MNTPVFNQEPDEVTTMFNPDGSLCVVIARKFGKVQFFNLRADINRVPGVANSNEDSTAPYSKDHTTIYVLFHEDQAPHVQELQQAIRRVVETYLTRIEPEPIQLDLFGAASAPDPTPDPTPAKIPASDDVDEFVSKLNPQRPARVEIDPAPDVPSPDSPDWQADQTLETVTEVPILANLPELTEDERIDRALAQIRVNLAKAREQGNKSEITILGVYRWRRTGQLRLAWESRRVPAHVSGMVITTDGGILSLNGLIDAEDLIRDGATPEGYALVRDLRGIYSDTTDWCAFPLGDKPLPDSMAGFAIGRDNAVIIDGKDVYPAKVVRCCVICGKTMTVKWDNVEPFCIDCFWRAQAAKADGSPLPPPQHGPKFCKCGANLGRQPGRLIVNGQYMCDKCHAEHCRIIEAREKALRHPESEPRDPYAPPATGAEIIAANDARANAAMMARYEQAQANTQPTAPEQAEPAPAAPDEDQPIRCELCQVDLTGLPHVKTDGEHIVCISCDAAIDRYADKASARYDRLLKAAERAQNESSALWKQAHQMAACIPMGQPLLVDHYSYKRDRNFRNRIWNKEGRAVRMSEKAQELERRASHPSRAIFSDDPAALLKLRDKLAALSAKQDRMIKVNKMVRGLPKTGELEERAQELSKRSQMSQHKLSVPEAIRVLTPDCFGNLGFADFELRNNNAEIRRTLGRIKELTQNTKRIAQGATAPEKERYSQGITLERSAEDNRLRLRFPGKPAREVIADLKHHGFRWAPSLGVWQRQLTDNAEYAASAILRKAGASKVEDQQ